MSPIHPIHRRIQAEELTRLRRSDERQRYAASQRRGRIDPNPHQVDAVIFALRMVREGGCILADEVGLGKTIEAGLVISQLQAEGYRRILIILPKPLMGQWQNELFTLFGVEAREGGRDLESYMGDGIFLVGREFAGGETGSGILTATDPFDLCVIDEAHEIFSGIYKRYSRDGLLNEDSKEARTAQRVREVLGSPAQTPVILLTATPIQNSLTEMWGLVQFVEPTGTLFGNLATFREVFSEPGSNDRALVPVQAHELRRRINTVCQRTLRRQAQEFLERPFTRRQAMLFEYTMSDAERSLYNDITEYLMQPRLCAFQGSQRRLLLISFHRLMASSLKALAQGLKGIESRLQKLLSGDTSATADNDRLISAALAEDLEHEGIFEDETEDTEEDVGDLPPELINAELERVQSFIYRTQALTTDAKADSLLDAVRLVIERGQTGAGSGKVVIFTESLTTQQYILDLITNSDSSLGEDDITLFRGVNNSARAQQALERWREEIEPKLSPGNSPSPSVAVRMALVHEFRTRSSVFISTEAGAKGLNLQFCDTLINYDLPWNPQRIEQRIGRCHRYSQTRDVTVINFLASDNEAQRLTFEILSRKLDLFGEVLDASDVVLHQPSSDAPETFATAIGADFESELGRIFDLARSQEELEAELKSLSDRMGDQRKRFEEEQARMSGLIESRLDDSVQQVFRKIADELPDSLAEFDAGLEQVVGGYLDARNVPWQRAIDNEGRTLLTISASTELPDELAAGLTVAIGHAKGLEDVDPLHLTHPLLLAAIDDARALGRHAYRVAFQTSADSPVELLALKDRQGRLTVTRAGYHGFEPVERLLVTAVLAETLDPVEPQTAAQLIRLPAVDLSDEQIIKNVDDEAIDDAVDEALFIDQSETAVFERQRFETLLEQIERYADDQTLVLRRQLLVSQGHMERAYEQRDAAMGPDARRSAERKLERLEKEHDRLEGRITELESRTDPDYCRWREHAHNRRFVAPELTRILDVEFVIQ